MTALHWKAELLHRDGPNLLPSKLPIEVLIHVARNMAMYKDGALDRFEMAGVWEFLTFWIDRLLNSQHEFRLRLFREDPAIMLPLLVDELDLWVRLELVSRLIDYPLYTITLTDLFSKAFSDVSQSPIGRTRQ